MKLSPAEQESIVQLLSRIYGDICEIEEQFQLLVGDHDFRPRIEYFHDAIRAFTSGENTIRLSVEFLAYDLASLRAIQSKPLSPFKPHSSVLSPSTGVMTVGQQQLSAQRQRPDRAVRERITELYQHYAVLFAALLKPFADRVYHERVDNLNQDVEDLQQLMAEYKKFSAGKGNTDDIGSAIVHLEDHNLRQQLLNFMHQQKHKKKENIDKLQHFLKTQIAERDKRIAVIDKAHLNYSMSQLGIFEESKDMLKKMAKSGMNLVGKFVEASIAEAKHDRGR